MLSRRVFLSMAGAAAAQRAFTAQSSRPPNFVVALCDDLGYGDLGCQGHRLIQTPRLDGFAREGIRFTDCHAAAPVCSPARAGLMTGRVPNRCGVYDWIPAGNAMHLPAREITVARLLRDAGYETCVSGKWHLNGMFNSGQQPQPSEHGFQHWFATQNNAAPTHENPTNFVRNGVETGALEGFSSDLIVDEAIRWLDEQAGSSRPFFLYAPFHSPHEPVATPERFTRLYPTAVKRGEALYYGNVTHMDEAFGRLLDALKRRGLEQNTLVLFTSDNGPETLNRYEAAWRSHGSPGRLRGMKLSLYEGGHRVPGMLRFPGRARAGTISNDPVSGVDLLPTLCELAGARAPGDRAIDGTSLVPLLAGRRVRRATPLHWHYFNALDAPRSAMREGDWKVAGLPAEAGRGGGGAFQPGRDMPRVKQMQLARFELYNLRRDPPETNDLAAREPRRLERMAAALSRLHDEARREGPDWS